MSMKSGFPEYFTIPEEELLSVWESGIIVPDTNILLHTLRHDVQTRDELFEVLGKFRGQLWVPHRVSFEFLRRWRDVYRTGENAFTELKQKIEKQVGSLC